MQANIGYYIHHHGSGHVMRAIAISRALPHCNITFLGSRLHHYEALMPANVNCLHLPMDTPGNEDIHHDANNPVDCLHYAPLNIRGLRERNKLITNFFSKSYPLLLIVDVSVEVALLARLCSVPTIVMRQHGHRDDTAHLAAYQSASALLAPYAQAMQGPEPAWLTAKTIYTGGFSRYTPEVNTVIAENENRVAIVTGQGGTSIDVEFVKHLAQSCSTWMFEVIGLPALNNSDVGANVTFHGHVNDPIKILSNCNVVIGNAGHNTIMEMASLNKRFIVIPEHRPFHEQADKAQILNKLNLAKVVFPDQLFQTNWDNLLNISAKSTPNWNDTAAANATQNAAAGIMTVYNSLFS